MISYVRDDLGWVGCVEGFNQDNLELVGDLNILLRAVIFVSNGWKDGEYKDKKEDTKKEDSSYYSSLLKLLF